MLENFKYYYKMRFKMNLGYNLEIKGIRVVIVEKYLLYYIYFIYNLL